MRRSLSSKAPQTTRLGVLRDGASRITIETGMRHASGPTLIACHRYCDCDTTHTAESVP